MSPQPDGIDATCTTSDSLTCLNGAYNVGLTILVAACLISVGSILYTFFFIVYANRPNAKRAKRANQDEADQPNSNQPDPNRQSSNQPNSRLLKVFGATGVALSTLLVAIYTFVGLVTKEGIKSTRCTGVIVLVIWAITTIPVGVGYHIHRNPSESEPIFMAPAPHWCWVSKHYIGWRVGGEYLCMWMTLAVSSALYILLYLRPRMWWFPSNRRELVTLWYPAVYCFCILPASIVRWITFGEEQKNGYSTMPSAATFSTVALFSLSGFFNVILIFTTRPNLGLFGPPPPEGDIELLNR